MLKLYLTVINCTSCSIYYTIKPDVCNTDNIHLQQINTCKDSTHNARSMYCNYPCVPQGIIKM